MTPTKDMLAPCPFCGSDAYIQQDDSRFYAACVSIDCYCAVGEAYDGDAMPSHTFYTEEDAAKAWNTRASTPAASGVGELASAIEANAILGDESGPVLHLLGESRKMSKRQRWYLAESIANEIGYELTEETGASTSVAGLDGGGVA